MHRNHRLVQQEGGALTRPAALAAEQLLDPGVHQATLIATLVPVCCSCIRQLKPCFSSAPHSCIEPCIFPKVLVWYRHALYGVFHVVDSAGLRKGSAPGLVMERAVQEMSQLRQEIAQSMAQYERGAQRDPQTTLTNLQWSAPHKPAHRSRQWAC